MADPRSSKIIGARLRAAAAVHSSAHPDPDLLTAFAEHSLTETERARILDHLSQCGVCRDVVYLAQPEEQAAPLQIVKAPPQVRWFAWKRLQWAALAASLSVIAGVAVLLKENPSRLPTAEQAKREVSNSGNAAQYEVNQPTSTAAASPATSASPVTSEEARKADNDNLRREALASKAPALEEKGRVSAGKAGTFNGERFGLSDDHAKPDTYFYDKEAKQDFKAGNETTKDANGKLVFSARDRLTKEEDKRLFDLRQQQARGGPAANNSNGINYAQNNLSLDGSANAYSATAPPPPPATAPSASNATGAGIGGGVSSLQKYDQLQAEKPAAAPPQTAAKVAAPVARAVVPAEEARNKKKLETIPSQTTPERTEETVAVAGQAQEVATNRASSGLITPNKIDDLQLSGNTTNMLVLAPGVVSVPASAATGWRVHQGQVQAHISGAWHTVVVGLQRVSGSLSRTLKSADSGVTRADLSPAAPPQRFSSVSAIKSDIWAAQSIEKDHSYVTVYHSHDGGASWEPSILTGAANLKTDAQVAVKFKNAQQGRVVLSTGETWQTSDGGTHWNLVK